MYNILLVSLNGKFRNSNPIDGYLRALSQITFAFFGIFRPRTYPLVSTFGGIQQLRVQNFAIFWPPPVWTVFITWAWTKTDIFWPPPPSSCPRSYWMSPELPWTQRLFIIKTKITIARLQCFTKNTLFVFWQIRWAK